MNKSRTLITMAALAAFGIAGSVFAAAPGGKVDVGVGGGIDTRATGPAAGINTGGGVVAPPASVSGSVNGNGAISTDRDMGQDRAADRRSAEGLIHEKATDNIDKHKAKMKKMHKPQPDGDDAGASAEK